MYILSNVPPDFDKETGKLNVYGGLAVAVKDSIPEKGAIWAGLVTDPTDTSERYDASTKITRLPLRVSDVGNYGDHYSRWCKGTIYAAFHSLMEYAGLEGDKYARPPAELEELYQSHVAVMDDFANQLSRKIRNKERFGGTIEPIMVHDYQLLLAAKSLKENGLTDRRIGFFLHIPFPPATDFARIPHADDILDAMLEYDFIGVQENHYSVANFIDTVKQRYPNATFNPETKELHVEGHSLSVKALPASIDPEAILGEVKKEASVPIVDEILEEANGRKIVLSAQRFDIIKGVPEALLAVKQILDANPAASKETLFVFCCQPTRYEGVTCYDDYQEECLDIIDDLEENYPGAIRMVAGLPREGLLQLMGKTDVMYVPTTIEGQNLVLKEYVVAQSLNDKPGILVMTTGCGAHEGMANTGGVFIMEPRDVNEHAEKLSQALDLAGKAEAQLMLKKQLETIHGWTSKDYGAELASEMYQIAIAPYPVLPRPANDTGQVTMGKKHGLVPLG